MQPLDLADVADLLLASNDGNPTDAAVRRSMSAIYYALFHFICAECADRIIGATASHRRQRAWYQVYRALDHKNAKVRCKRIGDENHHLNFPNAINDAAFLLVQLQAKRHEADYDPNAQITGLDAATYAATTRDSIRRFERVSKKHRKAFAAFLLVNHRQHDRG